MRRNGFVTENITLPLSWRFGGYLHRYSMGGCNDEGSERVPMRGQGDAPYENGYSHRNDALRWNVSTR